MKRILALLMALSMVFSFAVFANADAKDEVVITLASQHDPAGANEKSAYFLKKIEEFNATDNGIHVDLVLISDESGYRDRLSTDAAAGSLPNVFLDYGASRVLDYVENGLLYDLTAEFEKDPEWYNSFLHTEGIWTPVDFADFGIEGVYGIPYDRYGVVFLYNKSYLEKCGLEVPTTWEDVLNCCEVLKSNGIQPFNIGEGANYKFGHLFNLLTITNYGPETAKKIGTREIGYDSQEVKDVISLMADAYQKGYLGENILSFDHKEERNMFGEGKQAFQFENSSSLYWFAGLPEFDAKNIGVCAFPAVNPEYRGYAQGGTSCAYYISTQNATEEQIQASVELLKFMTSEDYMKGLSTITNTFYAMPARDDTAERLYIYEGVEEIMNDYVLLDEIQNFDTESAAVSIVRNALQTIVSENATADQVSATIIKEFEDIE